MADNAVPIGLVERRSNLVEVTAGGVLGQFGTGFGSGFMLKVVPEPLQESLIDLFKGQFRQAMVAVQVVTVEIQIEWLDLLPEAFSSVNWSK